MSDLKFFLGKLVINKQTYNTFLPSFHIMLTLCIVTGNLQLEI